MSNMKTTQHINTTALCMSASCSDEATWVSKKLSWFLRAALSAEEIADKIHVGTGKWKDTVLGEDWFRTEATKYYGLFWKKLSALNRMSKEHFGVYILTRRLDSVVVTDEQGRSRHHVSYDDIKLIAIELDQWLLDHHLDVKETDFPYKVG